jgi:hypothetical protein
VLIALVDDIFNFLFECFFWEREDYYFFSLSDMEFGLGTTILHWFGIYVKIGCKVKVMILQNMV